MHRRSALGRARRADRPCTSAPDADLGGYDFWLAELGRFRGNYVQAEMARAFTSSMEYRRRFGQP